MTMTISSAAAIPTMPSAVRCSPQKLTCSRLRMAWLSIEKHESLRGTRYLRADLAGRQQRMLPAHSLGREHAACNKGLTWRCNRRCHRTAVSMECQTACGLSTVGFKIYPIRRLIHDDLHAENHLRRNAGVRRPRCADLLPGSPLQPEPKKAAAQSWSAAAKLVAGLL
jgi:hypothetical protein